MASRRGRDTKVVFTLSLCLAVVSAIGCGVGDDGSWNPKPNPTPAEVVTGDTTTASSVNGLLPTEAMPALPQQTVADVTGNSISCRIPPMPAIDLSDSGDVHFYYDPETVCLGEEVAKSELDFCQMVEAFERHAQAVAECFSAAKSELDRQGTHVMGHAWLEEALPMLPQAWSEETFGVNQLAGRLSTAIVYLMTGGQSMEAEGSPVCFYRPPHTQPEAVKDQALSAIQAVASDTAAQLSHITSALRRGVDLQVNPDLRLQLTIKIKQVYPSIEPIDQCVFQTIY